MSYVTLRSGKLVVNAKWENGWAYLTANTRELLDARADLIGVVRNLFGLVGALGVDRILPKEAPANPVSYKFGSVVDFKVDAATTSIAFRLPWQDFVAKLLPLRQGGNDAAL